ncbi:hypothetical protein Ddye_024430 [Dipteronia dyeriana]|uniref:Transmembrane protein n=1 Tax=Dipteronia dyeriana TaxID=168575 RepID=A0AAD9TUX0_9ROSI|nr:hypothetical protein Ddye_024430 [Dipteronia dyeriana]
MATTTASVAASLSPLPQPPPPPPPPVSSIFKPKPCTTFINTTTHNRFTACCLSSRKSIVHFHHPISLGFHSKRYKLWRRNATSGEVSPSESTPIDTSEQIVSSTSGDGGTASTVVSVLLFIAFVALSILTIGVVYIAVTDFLQKREREKFEKEEATKKKKKKKGGKKMKVRARAGPRGFGQKIDDDDDKEEDDG